MLHRHQANPQEENHGEMQSQQSCFATLLKSPLHSDTPSKILITTKEILRKNTSEGLLLFVKRALKDYVMKSYHLQLLKEIH